MKKQFVLTLSTLIVISALSSCAPKDEKLTPGGASGSAQIQSVNIEGNKTESTRFLAVTLDRAFQGLSLIKAALDPEYASLVKISKNDDQFQTDVLDLTTGQRLESLKSGQFSEKMNYLIEKLEKDQDGKVISLVLKSDNSKLETKHFKDPSVQGSFVSSNNMNDRLFLTQGTRAHTYLLSIEKTEELGLAKNTLAYVNTQIKLEFQWDGSVEMLKQAVKVTALRINARMHGARTGALILKDLSPVLEVKLGECISATGELKIVKDQRTKIGENLSDLAVTPVKIEDSSLTLENITSIAHDCSLRPSVDLTRYLR